MSDFFLKKLVEKARNLLVRNKDEKFLEINGKIIDESKYLC